jgi:hypothetical protein
MKADAASGVSGVPGPVSEFLEAELRAFVRRHGLVIWLDADRHYTRFVEQLAVARAGGALPYEVRGYRGSHLALMLALEGVAATADPVPLVLHLPGFNDETVRETPVLELHAAGTRYRRSLTTLVADAAAGQVPPDAIAAVQARPDLTLEMADTWLSALIHGGEEGMASELRSMLPTALVDDLLKGGSIAGRLHRAGVVEAVWQALAVQLGLRAAWRDATLPPSSLGREDIAHVAASWALGVEYVDDLRRAPVSAHLAGVRGLPRALVDACRGLASHLRASHPAFYVRTADETEVLLDEEVRVAKAEDLGHVDTFRFEEDRVFQAALVALEGSNWDVAAEWSTRRVESGTQAFWLRDQPARMAAWQWIGKAARLGQAVVRAGARLAVETEQGGALEAAIEAYVARGAEVDRAHRQMEQGRVALLASALPEYAQLRACQDGSRRVWRQWADGWARDWNALCRRWGFLPPAGTQQRMIFDDVVRPMVQESGTTAYFVVDALRYEMAQDLASEMREESATTTTLRARLAELPTVTEVGMNVLAPVVQGGRLKPVAAADGCGFVGFRAGEFRVSDPDTRRRAMQDRVGGVTCPWMALEEVVNRDSVSLRRSVAQARLVVVHSRELDIAGENGMGPAMFAHVLSQLRAAWRLLREAGVRRFVFTGDHGFLLLDESAAAVQPHGRRVDPGRRHVFTPVAADHAGEIRVALSELGYDGVSGYLQFPETTAVFDRGGGTPGFVHGGNSLQERVIPVLTVVHRASAGGTTVRHAIDIATREDVAGLHCLRLQVRAMDQAALDFGGAREVELAFRVTEVPGVQVEVRQARERARIEDGRLLLAVGEWGEVFFQLTGATDARVQVEVYHPGAIADVSPLVMSTRYPVLSRRAAVAGEATGSMATNWLAAIADPGARKVLEHIAAHGAITEEQVAVILGSARAARRFAVGFEQHAAQAPFAIRIADVGGIKRYMKEQSI